MINELHKLATTLDRNNIGLHRWHSDYKPLPNGDCYRIWLCNDGTVKKIELMSKGLVAVCRKYGNNQRAFPAFNIAPLYRITSREDEAFYDALVKGNEKVDIDRLVSMCVNDNWDQNLLKKVDGCLKKKIPAMPEDSAIFSLMSITERMDGSAFRTALEDCVRTCLQGDIKTYLPILFHKGNARPPSIMLDLADWEQFGDPIASENTTKQINNWLQVSFGNSETPEVSDLDAFGTAYNDIGKSEAMPSVKLLDGFEVALRSMFSEQICQHRYRKADDQSYPIAQPNRSATKTALEWIVRRDEGETWRKIDKGAMLFVYPDKLPLIPPKFADLFGKDGGNIEKQKEPTKEYRFEKVAKDFITALNAIEPKNRPEGIQIFALQQILPALSKRAKVVFTRNLTVNGLLDAAREWQNGCRNLPDIFLVEEPSIPFPLDVSGIANKVWKQNGTRADGKSTAKLMQYYQGMELLLDAPIPSQLLRIVRGITVNWLGFILFVGNNIGIPRKKNPYNKDKHGTEIANLFSLLGLILYKYAVKKEDYMQDTAYLIGQILKVSDALHALYCEIKRDGDIPPQLAGNAVFVTASETPAKALALLSTRMPPYIAWAKQYRTQKDEKNRCGLVGWYLRQYEILMTQLHPKLTEDIRFKELEKSQLFIGYLASLPKSGNEQLPEQEDLQDEQ